MARAPRSNSLAEPPLVDLDRGRVGEVDAADPAALPVRRVAEPDVVQAAVLAAHESVDRCQLVEQRRALGDVRQLPQRHLHAHRVHGGEVAGGVRETVGGELEVAVPVAAEPVGVEVQHVEGQVLGPHPLGHLQGLGGRRVRDLRLPEPERPVRRDVRPTGQLGVGPEHLANVTDEHERVEPVVVHGHLQLRCRAAADPRGEPGVVVREHSPPCGGDPERHVLVGPRGDRAQCLGHVHVDRLADLVESAELLTEAVDALVLPDREHLGGQPVALDGCAADAGGERIPRAHQVRLPAADRADHAPVRASHPQGRPTDLGHLDLDRRLAAGDGHSGPGPLASSIVRHAHVGDQHRGVTCGNVGAEGEPVAERARSDRLDAHGERARFDPVPRQGHALGQSGDGGVRRGSDVEDHEPVADLTDRRGGQSQTVDLEVFEVPGRWSVGMGVHAGGPVSRGGDHVGAGSRLAAVVPLRSPPDRWPEAPRRAVR